MTLIAPENRICHAILIATNYATCIGRPQKKFSLGGKVHLLPFLTFRRRRLLFSLQRNIKSNCVLRVVVTPRCARQLIRIKTAYLSILADRTARSMIDYWHDNVVCLSVCPSFRLSVTLCIMAKRYIYTVKQRCLNT